MTDRSTIEARLRELYTARVRADTGAVCACFDESAALRFAGAGGTTPVAVAARGAREYRALLALMIKSFKLADFETLSTLVDGERAAVHWRARILSRITGTSVVTEFIDLVEFSNGRIGQYTEFFAPR